MEIKKTIVIGLGNNLFKNSFDKKEFVSKTNQKNNYQYTRHNIGTMFLEFMIRTKEKKWKESPTAWITKFNYQNKELIFIKLKSWMNDSGIVLKKTLLDLKLQKAKILICTDNLDLKFGVSKIKNYLSDNGHKGLDNIKNYFNPKQIMTLHIGIDKRKPIEQWVLSNFTKEEKNILETKIFPELAANLFQSWKNNENRNDFIKYFFEKVRKKTKGKNLAIVGGQWGDEGKGKIVDYFASQNYPIVARFSGGDNAGHTIKIKEKKYEFSILPVSIIQPKVVSIIGRGCLINLEKLVNELQALKKIQKEVNLKISPFAHLILPYHILLDELQEKQRKNEKIGTTKRGIGPCSEDKVSRFGLRIGDLKNKINFQTKLKTILDKKNIILEKIYQHPALEIKAILKKQLNLFDQIKEYVDDVWTFLWRERDKNILFEGAQGTLLDINFGTYPFVTSSSVITWQIGNSFGQLCHKTCFMGVFKSYSTRVGTGPMWTEMDEKKDKNLIKEIVIKGNEFGVVTKRQRRIGWFDAVAARYACQINGFHKITLTMLDVFSGFEKIKICTNYIQGKKKIFTVPFEQNNSDIKCEYIILDGWKENISQCKTYSQLPLNAKKYVEKIETLLEVPVVLISVGPERNQTIWKKVIVQIFSK